MQGKISMTVFQHSQMCAFTDAEIPRGSNILLTGPPGIGKTIFCESLLCECLRNGTNILHILLDYAPKVLRSRIDGQGIDLTNGKNRLIFLDGYSWLVGGSNEKYYVGNLSNLSDLSVKMATASTELGEGFCFIFDSVSTLLVYNSENDVERFLEVNMARMKHINSTGLWIAEQGIHSERFYNTLRHMVDGILEMHFEENKELKRFIRMHTLRGLPHSTAWKPFFISKTGIVTVGEETQP